jgi:uncharacterized protein YwqG
MLDWLRKLGKGREPEPKAPRSSDFGERLREGGFDRRASEIQALVRPCLVGKPTPTDDDRIPVGGTKSGGRPDLPPGFGWPEDEKGPLPFIAQLDLAELRTFAHTAELPEGGVLSFFYSAHYWGFDPKDRRGFRVEWFPDSTGLRRRSAAATARKGDFEEPVLYPSCTLALLEAASPPDPDSIAMKQLGLSEEEESAYADLHVDWDTDVSHPYQVLGNPSPIQGEMQLECQLVSHGLDCGDGTAYGDPRAKELAPGAADWRLLLQVDSSDDAGMMWGDVGMVYFWIREQDLRDRRFDQVWAVMQCS